MLLNLTIVNQMPQNGENWLGIAIVFLSSITAIIVYPLLRPKLLLRIIPRRWENKEHDLVKIRMEIENCSKIEISVNKIRLQILEHNELRGWLSEWVPFHNSKSQESNKNESEADQFNRKHLKSEPAKWQEPFRVFETTEKISPGEIISGERLHFCSPDSILHVGLQVQAKLGILARISRNLIKRQELIKPQEQWTTTIIIMNTRWSGQIFETPRPSEEEAKKKGWWKFWR